MGHDVDLESLVSNLKTSSKVETIPIMDVCNWYNIACLKPIQNVTSCVNFTYPDDQRQASVGSGLRSVHPEIPLSIHPNSYSRYPPTPAKFHS